MSYELEVLEQLLGGELPIHVVAGLFPDLDHCQRALIAMSQSGDIEILDPQGEAIPEWRLRALQSDPVAWTEGSGYTVAVTDAGSQRVT